MNFSIKFYATVLFFLLIKVIETLKFEDIVILILSQTNKYNEQLALNLKQNILQQAADLHQIPEVILSHQDIPHVGGWTVLPLIPQIVKHFGNNSTWVVVITEQTQLQLDKLFDVLETHNNSKEIWLGYALFDREATIIHHFTFYDDPSQFLYPNMASGFAISMPLLKTLAYRLKKLKDVEMDFSIDPAHELALFIWDRGKGIRLLHESAFCITEQSHCALYVKSFVPCSQPVSKKSLYFAVKTCHKFHKTRVPVIQNTWAKYVTNLRYFSDDEDENIPTTVLNVPNTEQGHCGKTMAILQYVSTEIRNKTDINWVVVVDDDTILSSVRLGTVLSCYNASDNVALGERYGYKVFSHHGYNYITGGGGIVFSASVVHRLSAPGVCQCPTNDSPDDMFLGVCLARLGIDVTHSPFFHQARPNDYALEYLSTQEVVSFHKHWMIDPISVYQTWFENADLQIFSTSLNKQKIEL